MITLLITSWWLVGFVTAMSICLFSAQDILRKDIAAAFFFGGLGPIILVVILILMTVSWANNTDWWDKPVWRRK